MGAARRAGLLAALAVVICAAGVVSAAKGGSRNCRTSSRAASLRLAAPSGFCRRGTRWYIVAGAAV